MQKNLLSNDLQLKSAPPVPPTTFGVGSAHEPRSEILMQAKVLS